MRVSREIYHCLSIILLVLTCCGASAQNKAPRVRNIVLVHGAWVDGSGWKGVYDILIKEGYNVSIVQEPLTSFQEDVAAVKRVLAQQDGPCKRVEVAGASHAVYVSRPKEVAALIKEAASQAQR